MNTRSKAKQAAKSQKIPLAITQIRAGLKAIRKLYEDVDQTEEFAFSPEVEILKQLGRKMQKKLPGNPLRLLEQKLQRAIEEEKYEDAALIRNQISNLKKRRSKRKAKKNRQAPDEE